MDKDNKTTSSSTPLNGSSGLSKLSIFIGAFIAFMTLISLIILGYSVENYNSINTMDSCTNPAVVVSPNPKVSLPDATCNPVCVISNLTLLMPRENLDLPAKFYNH